MQKVLLKLFLPLLILAVLNPGAYNLSEFNGTALTGSYQSGIKKQAQSLPLVKNLHAESISTYVVHGFVKPLWVGNLDFSQCSFAKVCRSLFILDKQHVIHRQEFLQSLLFPFHFFS
ncbi:hypothetical protein [Mucilaginibacter sp.]|uniref:hypothetical protein n=1 Tax=Mucilaginibacter sp. TaxID=1882438 RepID=UPI0025DE4B23|nr:hypothetical protein [Mucilaginibacter sp.]